MVNVWSLCGGITCSMSSDIVFFFVDGVVLFVAVVYVADVMGVPLAMFGVLWKNRLHLWDKKSPKHEAVLFELGGLYQQYEPKYWWFGKYNFFVLVFL